ncbi:hypothetical protein ACVBEQ_12700 [Nakamurella sp. GG22]
MSEPTGQPDPLRPRQRPGVRVEAEVATWESVVFAITVGAAVRYLEVPAAQVPLFLEKVDSGELDEDLVELATRPTGATLNMPGRIRTLAAFDRLVRGAVARAERDPLSGELTGPGWRPRKRRRDDRSRSESDHQPDPTTHSIPTPTPSPRAPAHQPAMTPVGAGAAIAPVVKGGWWSSPAVAVGAVVAVVVLVAGVVFAVARPSDDPQTRADAAATVSPASTPTAAASAVVTSALATSASGTSASGTSAPGTSAAGTSAAATTAGTSAAPTAAPSATARPSGTSSGAPPANPIAGTYSGVRTITANSGHPEAAIGTSEPLDLTITAACAEPTCAVSAKGWGTAAVTGSTLKFSGTATEPCKDSPGITVEDSWSVTLKAAAADPSGAVQKLTGVGTVTVSALNGCDAKVYPLTWSYSITRSG